MGKESPSIDPKAIHIGFRVLQLLVTIFWGWFLRQKKDERTNEYIMNNTHGFKGLRHVSLVRKYLLSLPLLSLKQPCWNVQ